MHSAYGSYGVSASQLRNTDKDVIVIQAGNVSLVQGTSALGGDGFGRDNGPIYTLPYRLILICLD